MQFRMRTEKNANDGREEIILLDAYALIFVLTMP